MSTPFFVRLIAHDGLFSRNAELAINEAGMFMEPSLAKLTSEIEK